MRGNRPIAGALRNLRKPWFAALAASDLVSPTLVTSAALRYEYVVDVDSVTFGIASHTLRIATSRERDRSATFTQRFAANQLAG